MLKVRMARKQRIEFPGAVYHIIGRGASKRGVFSAQETGEDFEEAIFEVVKRCGWRLHAYVIMSDHYHLALETPQPNLVVGMKWLQGAFATRFNRIRNEHGQVFQGRYKSILMGKRRSVVGLVNYIHLNPVRAGVSDVAGLKNFGLSSYPKFFKKTLADGLTRRTFLAELGLPDEAAAMRSYSTQLQSCDEADSAQQSEIVKRYCQGWFSGSYDEKQALMKAINEESSGITWDGSEFPDADVARWEKLVQEFLKHLNRSETDLRTSAKGVFWKAEIARALRATTTATNGWIAERLNMGHPSRISNLLRTHR